MHEFNKFGVISLSIKRAGIRAGFAAEFSQNARMGLNSNGAAG